MSPTRKSTRPTTSKKNSKKSSVKKGVSDPFAEREASKYDKPIPSREYILKLLEKQTGPIDEKTLTALLALAGEDEKEGLRRRLIAMRRDGQLVENRKGGLLPLSKADVFKGRVIGHPDGFGFVSLVQGGDDLFLHHKQMRSVFHGDEVLVRHRGTDFRGRPEAAIVEVLKRNTSEVVGRFFQEGGVSFVRPDNKKITQDILLLPEQALSPTLDQIVVVEIVDYPSARQLPTGVVKEILGDELDPGLEIDIAVRNHGIPFRWPEVVKQEARKISDQIEIDELINREDLRHLPFVTIDGEDARDFDDAVFCEKNKHAGWTLYVAIADVSHYVKVESALDQEAFLRGTSVYFPGSVVPMLPEKLSNGVCSLNPHVDRLALVCKMEVTKNGELESFQFLEAIFHSHARLTYTQVGAFIEGDESIDDRTEELVNLYDLYKVLLKKRKKRGAIEFETTETRILFDDKKKIDKIIPVHRNDAHRLIEECMLAANTCAAKLLEMELVEAEDKQALFRVHEGPSDKKLTSLHSFLGGAGLTLGGGDKPSPEHYQTLLSQITERPDAHVLQTMLLRSMSQAVYQTDNVGHFGLNYPSYAHFTSPIRRYPDLLVHRAIRYLIRNRRASEYLVKQKDASKLSVKEIYPYSDAQMVELGEHCSMTERRADEASRDVQNWLKCEYLLEHIGSEYAGVISGVTSFGFFVELTELYVEGLVHVSSLQSDYYHFDSDAMCLIGERSSQSYRLGDQVKVRVDEVDLDERKVDFELLELVSRPGGRLRKSSKKSSNKSARNKKHNKKSKEGKSKNSSSKKSLNKSAPKSTKRKASSKRKRKTSTRKRR